MHKRRSDQHQPAGPQHPGAMAGSHLLQAHAVDVPSAVPGPCWRTLRGWLDDMELVFEPNLHPEHGLMGYAVRLRNWLLGVGLSARSTGPVLTLSAVLCRGMDREGAALQAVDKANARLTLGQILYFPGPPAELSFFASTSFDLLDQATFGMLFDAMLQELNNVGFVAVMQVRGYHPTDYAAPWGDPMMAPIDDDSEEFHAEPLPVDAQEAARDRDAQDGAVAGDGDEAASVVPDAGTGAADDEGPQGAGDHGD